MLDASAHAEQPRILDHFGRVLRKLSASTPRGLLPSQQRSRGALIDELTRYRAQGRFPRNRHFPKRFVPTFIDVDGTHCAVAHLLDRSGHEELALDVARLKNHARVPALLGFSELGSWVEASGITADEAALIQPSYCVEPLDCVCGRVDQLRATTLVEGTAVSSTEILVDAVYGEPGLLNPGDTVAITYMFGPGQVSPGELIIGGAFDTDFVALFKLLDRETVDAHWCVRDPTDELRQAGIFLGAPKVPYILEKQTLIAAVLEDSCRDVLVGEDPQWSASACYPAVQERSDCAFGGAAPAQNDATLVVALCALAIRRLSRRRTGA